MSKRKCLNKFVHHLQIKIFACYILRMYNNLATYRQDAYIKIELINNIFIDYTNNKKCCTKLYFTVLAIFLRKNTILRFCLHCEKYFIYFFFNLQTFTKLNEFSNSNIFSNPHPRYISFRLYNKLTIF